MCQVNTITSKLKHCNTLLNIIFFKRQIRRFFINFNIISFTRCDFATTAQFLFFTFLERIGLAKHQFVTKKSRVRFLAGLLPDNNSGKVIHT